MEKTTMGERFKADSNPMIVCPYRLGSGRPFDDNGEVNVRDGGGFWLKNRKKVAFLIGYLRKEFNLDKAKISVRKLAKSAGIVLTSYDLAEFQESLLWQDLMADEEAASLVKSILLEKGLSADGSIEAFELRRKAKIMPLVLKRKVWWEPVPGASSYVVYLSDDRAMFEPDNFLWETTPGIISKRVIGKTEVILPDDWPEVPKEPKTYYIGITSRDDLGNQSDPFLVSGSFKFLAPPAPSQGGIESL
jgi:hypothetical protein